MVNFSCKILKGDIPQPVMDRISKLRSYGYECWIVGGASLYHYAGKHLNIKKHQSPPKDYDLFTNCTSENLFKIFNDIKAIGGQERLSRIFTVITSNGIEISTYRQGGEREEIGYRIIDHLVTCDYTINAIAYDGEVLIIPDMLIDHLNNNKLVAMGNPQDRINEDNNRVMRAFRFTGKYNLYIDDDLYEVLINTDISKIPMENIRDELFKLLPYPHGLNAFIASGKFFELFPEMEQMIGLYGNSKYHEEDVWEHSLTTYTQMTKLTTDPILLFTALFHDYGKIFTIDSLGKFINHDEIGSQKLKELLIKLKIKNKDQNRILWLVRNHMWTLTGESKKKKKWFKFFNSMEDSGATYFDFMYIRYTDHISKKLNGSWLYDNNIDFAEFIESHKVTTWMITYTTGLYPKRVINLAINGNDLIALGVHPGPKIGNILNKLYEMVIADELKNEYAVLIRQVKRWMKLT